MTVAVSQNGWATDGGRRISLLDVDERFAAAVPAHEHAIARRSLTMTGHQLRGGGWEPPAPTPPRAPLGVIVVDGAILRQVPLTGRPHAQLLGEGDFLRPWSQAETLLPGSMSWTVLESATVAVLDERFLVVARRWPDLMGALHDRLCDQLDRAAHHAAICCLPRVEDRTLALFVQLADRWGAVTTQGIRIRLSLTHDQIGQMIGAKRPTVSLALITLADAGVLRRADNGTWLLSATAAHELTPAAQGHRTRLIHSV